MQAHSEVRFRVCRRTLTVNQRSLIVRRLVPAGASRPLEDHTHKGTER